MPRHQYSALHPPPQNKHSNKILPITHKRKEVLAMFGMVPYNRRETNLFRFFDDMERSFFNDTVSGSAQFRCDITDRGDKYMLQAELPGFDKDDIHVELSGDRLTISAEHKTEKDEKDDAGNYIRRERSYGSYSRSFDVSGIDAEHIEAEYKNGVLGLSLPKAQPAKPETRKIEIGSK